jgi:ankyrin repeat protein
VRNGSLDVLKLLLEHGLDPNILEPHEKATLLITAVEHARLDAAGMLLSFGADPNQAANGSFEVGMRNVREKWGEKIRSRKNPF